MDQLLTTVPAHFDGTEIKLDVPVRLEPNARLLVTILDPSRTLLYELMTASSSSLSQVWDNDADAVYDAY